MIDTKSGFHLKWQPNYKILLFSGFFLPVTIVAALWQLERAEHKQVLLDEQKARSESPVALLENVDTSTPQNYRRVSVEGEWSEDYFLLENRVRNGRPGYEVIGHFHTRDALLLVNRGWVETGYDRTILPVVNLPDGPRRIHGYLYRSNETPFTLGEQRWAGAWPERIVALEWNAIEARLGRPPYPYIVRLDAASDDALITGWEVVNLMPERHIGYVVQWSLMALALLVLTLVANSNVVEALRRRR